MPELTQGAQPLTLIDEIQFVPLLERGHEWPHRGAPLASLDVQSLQVASVAATPV